MKYLRRPPIIGYGKKLPAIRRKYTNVYGLDAGLDFSKSSTMITNESTPNCEEVNFRDSNVSKSTGTFYFAGTDTVPLLDKPVMGIYLYTKTSVGDKLIVNTTTNAYAYNSNSGLLECITRGVVVEDCEDVWAVNANVTCDVSTDARKGTYSVAITIASGFTTGVAAYENFTSKDLSTYDHLHFYIKSNIATVAGDLRIRLSEQNAGGTGATYATYNVPALTAGVWEEISVALAAPDADNGGTYPTDLNAVLSVSLVVNTDKGAQIVYIDDVMCTIEGTGDEDNPITYETFNDYCAYSNGIIPIQFWDMSAATFAILTGCTNISAKKIGKLGERLILFHVNDTVPTAGLYPRRVKWTIAGGLSTPPAATDWTDTGSGSADLDSNFGQDVIVTAEKLGNYYILYGEENIVSMEYTGKVTAPYSFYNKIGGLGIAAEKAIVNLKNEHIFLGNDLNIYSYKGSVDVTSIGDKIFSELYESIQPEFVSRSFMSYLKDTNEIRLHYVYLGGTTPNRYFSLNLDTGAWSRGTRSYTACGEYVTDSSKSWDTIGDSPTSSWDDQALGIRWDDVTFEALSPITLYGTSSGIIEQDNDSVTDLADGTAIDAWWQTKDFVASERYRGAMTNWMELNFEARGDKVLVSHSVDQGLGWSTPEVVTLTSEWKSYRVDFETNSETIRFKFANSTAGSTFELRWIEVGYVPCSDRGK
jgi:hypothetical protein